MRLSIAMMIVATGLWACAPAVSPRPEPIVSPTTELPASNLDASGVWKDNGVYNLAEMIVENVPDNYRILEETLNPEFFVAYDAGKVRKRNGVSKIDTLVVRYTPFPNPPLTGAKSIAMQQEFDCRRGRYRVVAYTAFSGWGLTGEEVAKHLEGISDQWFFVRPQTVDSAIMREACG